MLRVITINFNGIRSATDKGFFTWLSKQRADIVCGQETRAHNHQLAPEALSPRGFHAYFHNAERKGYSGVALYSRKEPDSIIEGLGWEDWDHEGRYIQADYGNLSVISIYIPSGTSGDERQQLKYGFLDRLKTLLRRFVRSGRDYIICGDWNIAHKPIDLKNWKSNQKNSGFLPEERAWMDELFGDVGLVDAFRVINQKPEQYTWWSNRGRARENNVGWRLDYQVVTPGLADKIKAARIYTDKKFSDHAPLIMDYEIEL